MSIGYKISRVREVLGIKQEDLAARLNISQQMVSKLEQKDRIDANYLNDIANALGVPSASIEEFNEASLVTSINQQGGQSGVFLNPLEAVIKLYKEKLQLKNKEIEQLKKEINNLTNT